MAAKNRIGAGDLIHSVAFDKRGKGDDGYGNEETTFQQQFTCRAAYRHRGGSEAVMAARLEGRQVLGVYLRSAEQTRAVAAEWRMRDLRTGQSYNVKVVDSVTDRKWVYLTVESSKVA